MTDPIKPVNSSSFLMTGATYRPDSSEDAEDVGTMAQGLEVFLPSLCKMLKNLGKFITSTRVWKWVSKKTAGPLADSNIGFRAILGGAQPIVVLTGGGAAAVSGLGAAITGLQLTQGLTLIYIAAKSLPESANALKDAENFLEHVEAQDVSQHLEKVCDDALLKLKEANKQKDSNVIQQAQKKYDAACVELRKVNPADIIALKEANANYSAALVNHRNNQCFLVLGILFLIVGSLGAVAFIGAQAGLAVAGVGAALFGSTVFGGVLSVASVGYGGFLMYQSIKNMMEINEVKKLFNKPLEKINLKEIIKSLEPKQDEYDDWKMNWVRCERIFGKKATDELKKVDDLSKISDEKKRELLTLIKEGISKSYLKQKVGLGTGFLVLLGGVVGVAGTALTPFTGGTSSVIPLALLGIGIGASGLGVMQSTGFIAYDTPSVLNGIKNIIDRVGIANSSET